MCIRDREFARRNQQTDSLNNQIKEYQTIMEQQYQKIVEVSGENDELKDKLRMIEQENAQLAERLAPFERLQKEAETIVASAKTLSLIHI